MTTQVTPPLVRPADTWRFPEAREHRLSNGMRVLAYDCPGQYVIAASLLFDVTLDEEPRDIEGVAAMVARCLTQGLVADRPRISPTLWPCVELTSTPRRRTTASRCGSPPPCCT
ncbi:MAG: hypothetical protein WKF73_02900 [Nocardioidaceae bacterium]